VRGVDRVQGLKRSRPRLILDRGPRLGEFGRTDVGYDVSLAKEELARQYILERQGTKMRFLDIGARDGRLDYLLGIERNLSFDEGLWRANHERFTAKYEYFGLDLAPEADDRVLTGDVCDPSFVADRPEYRDFFDVVYSNNVFEHLRRPWIAARNVVDMIRPGGICITITPFSIRYHESPADYFRYTHTGLASLFEDSGRTRTVVTGYDLHGRRNDWQGLGTANDICPVDRFGAWRENWFTVCIVEKLG
jgi:SAM-dependent methyltransferase